jgi:hypothetical protein
MVVIKVITSKERLPEKIDYCLANTDPDDMDAWSWGEVRNDTGKLAFLFKDERTAFSFTMKWS